VVLTVAEALAWYLIHPYDERCLYLYLLLIYLIVSSAPAPPPGTWLQRARHKPPPARSLFTYTTPLQTPTSSA
jgi:hypothetical protein